MEDMKKPHLWWFESHSTCHRRSPWLQSTLEALEEKTKEMLKLIEEDADSFAERAEMYYKKRPELMNMVQEFYKAHRLLAERYDQVKSDTGSRLITTLGSPFFTTTCQSEKSMCTSDRHSDNYSETCDPEESAESDVKCQSEKSMSTIDRHSDHYSETYDAEDSAESDVDDPEQDDENQAGEKGAPYDSENEEAQNLRDEIEQLKEVNQVQKDEIIHKDEQKREVIRQLSIAMELLREENVSLRNHIAQHSPKKQSLTESSKFKWAFWRNH